MSATCHDCGADHGTVGVVQVENEPSLCVECLRREGVAAPHLNSVKLTHKSKPRLPLKADRWEIDYDIDYSVVGPKGEGWWLIATHAVMHPDTAESGPGISLVRVYARRKEGTSK